MIEACRVLAKQPVAYMTIPAVAALVGYGTNWVGVKMIFYPIEFWGIQIRRWPEQPLGLLGWQGIVPCKAKKMSRRLVDIITQKLLSVREAFSQLEAEKLALLLEPSVASAIEEDASWGEAWLCAVRPFLRPALVELVKKLQQEIDSLIDLRKVVQSAFLADKVLLGQLFQKAGRKELAFLVDSGLGFGFLLGVLQMFLWIILPSGWMLPVGGALVGYITNWAAIKLIFDPVEPVKVGPLVIQGLFEKRQAEVSLEFSEFLANRVLSSPQLFDELVNGSNQHKLKALVRSSIPSIVPDNVANAALGALRKLARADRSHPVHVYVEERLQLRQTLNLRLCKLSSAEFENLLHPVFEEDEFTLIVAGGVLGAAAGALQMFFGWGGPMAGGALATVLAAGSHSPAAAAGAGVSCAALLLPLPLLLSGCLRRLVQAARGLGSVARSLSGSRLRSK